MMQKKGHNRRKLNNKGLSLVEVLVAMLVLSIASIALLRSFSYAVQLNTKSKETQYASVLAQSLMESLKAYDVDTLDVEFNRSAADYAGFTVFPVSNGVSFSQSGADLAARQYGLNNVQFNGSSYDVLIKMTPNISHQKDLAKVKDANRYNDAFFKQNIGDKQLMYDDILAYLINNCGADPAYTGSVDPSYITINSRKITVSISDQTVNYSVTYNYSLNNYEIVKLDATLDQINASNSFTIDYDTTYAQKYDNTATTADGAVLENIYIYYYPHYKNLTAYGYHPCNSDQLEIINNSSGTKNVFVIRQKDWNLNDANLSYGESDYKLKVDNTGSQSVDLYHNVTDSLTGSGMPGFDGTPSNVNLVGTPWQGEVTTTNLLYDVEITVSKNGEEFCKLEGTTNAQ